MQSSNTPYDKYIHLLSSSAGPKNKDGLMNKKPVEETKAPPNKRYTMQQTHVSNPFKSMMTVEPHDYYSPMPAANVSADSCGYDRDKLFKANV